MCSMTMLGVFRAPDPHIVLVDSHRYMRANFFCEHDLLQVTFVIIGATECFKGKDLAFVSIFFLCLFCIPCRGSDER